MATSKPDLSEDLVFPSKPYPMPRRPHGCFFYGCLISGGLALLFVVAVGVFSYMAYRSLVRFVEENTATAPRELPKVALPDAAELSLKARIESFKKAIDAGEPTEPLILTADDLNALIEEDPRWKGQAYLTIEGEKLGGKVSIPLDTFGDALGPLGLGLLRGRYFNGEVELKAALKDGILNVLIESLEVNGRRLPKEFADVVKKTTVEISKDPDIAEDLQKVESLEVKDGKIIIKGRATKKGPGPGTSRALPDLPDDVMAPAEASPPP
jgi:hypothetical protein